MSYQWWPIVDYVPGNGASTTVDLRAALTDAGGPVSNRLSYPLDSRPLTDVNRRSNPIIYGLRPRLDIVCDVLTLADQAVVATLVSRLMSPDWTVYLSLDGGVTSRRISLLGYRGPEPLGGKTVAGARHTVSVEVFELLTELTSMTAAPLTTELIQDGQLANWNGNDAFSWIEIASGGNTVAVEGAVFVSSPFSVTLTWNASGNCKFQSSRFDLAPYRFARLRFWARGGAANLPYLKVRLVNETQQTSLNGSGVWTAGISNNWQTYTPGNLTFTQFDQTLQAGQFGALDQVYVEFSWEAVTPGQLVSIDDVSLLAPVLPSGVARW